MTAIQDRLTPPAPVVGLSVRAYSAASKRGLDTSSLLAADDALGIDSGAWRGELLALVIEAWPECDVSVHHHYGVSEDSAVIVIMASDLSDRDDSWEKWDAEGYDDCLVAALEAAPAKVTT